MSTYFFYTDCTNSDAVGPYGECINEMTQSPHCEDLDSHDFMLNIAQQHHFQEGLAELFNHDSLTDAADDFALSCYRSRFQGQPCYYVKFSGIEHIFIDKLSFRHLVTGDELHERIAAIEALDEALDDYAPWQDAKSPEEYVLSLTGFVELHYETFLKHNAQLGSLFAYSNPFQDLVRQLDHDLFIQPAAIQQTLHLQVRSKHELFNGNDSTTRFSEQIKNLVESQAKSHYNDTDLALFVAHQPVDASTINITLSHAGTYLQGFSGFTTGAIQKGTKYLSCLVHEQRLSLTPASFAVQPETPPNQEIPSVTRSDAPSLRR